VNVTLWLERFGEHLRLGGRSERTVYSYGYSVRAFLSFLSDRGLSEAHEVRREDVEAYQVFLHRQRKPDGQPLSLTTQNGYMAAVLAFLKFLRKANYVLSNPGGEVKLVKVPRRLLGELLTEDEVLSLLAAPDVADPLGLRDRAILEVLYSSALRNAELRALELADVDLQRLEVRVRLGKGRQSRVVPLGEPAAIWVEKYLREGRAFLLRERDPGLLFLTARGEKITSGTLAILVRRHTIAAGLKKKVTPHLLRHCCATHMLARQAGLRHLQEMLGHASAETTQAYTRVEISDLREVHRRCHPRESF
jgi:integrase/recombinase XerD